MKKIYWTNLILILFMIAGLGLLIYPSLSDLWNESIQSKAVASYKEQAEKIDNKKAEEMIKEAVEYNDSLLKKNNRFVLTPEEKDVYNNILDITGTGILGYVEIDKIGVSLPIYHGTDSTILESSIGHLEGTSFPVPGKSVHSAISGHRGLRSAKLFTDLDQMEIGDLFAIRVLNFKYNYQVDRIVTILPDELDELSIEVGENYATLFTCTPYGINSHRLMVRGKLVSINEDYYDPFEVTVNSKIIEKKYVTIAFSLLILILTFIYIKIKTYINDYRSKVKQRGGEDEIEKNS